MQNCVKMTLWSSREPFGALLGRKVYFKTSLGSGLYSFWEPLGIPFGNLFATFSSLGRSWHLKMVAFGRGPFGHYFLDRNLIKIRSPWDTENLDNMCEGLQKSCFRLCCIWEHFRYRFGHHFGTGKAPQVPLGLTLGTIWAHLGTIFDDTNCERFFGSTSGASTQPEPPMGERCLPLMLPGSFPILI